jgi:hypothetical protein
MPLCAEAVVQEDHYLTPKGGRACEAVLPWVLGQLAEAFAKHLLQELGGDSLRFRIAVVVQAKDKWVLGANEAMGGQRLKASPQ